jgi:hypothetical protein
MTKVNKWTLGLAAVGLVSLPAIVQAEEKPNQLLTALSSTTISGYVDTSAHWNPGTGNANPPAYAYNTPAKQDGFNLNVIDLTLEKPLDEGTWSAGYKVELWFGPNASVLGNNIVGAGAGGPASGNDVSLKQGYVALRAPVGNGLDLKIGTFDTIIGYEVANSGSNPNYTRSWGYSIEPTQQSGVLASYQVNKMIGLSAGIANLWSAGVGGGVPRSPRSESDKTYMGAVTLTAPDDWGFIAGSALYLGIVDGFSAPVGNDVTSYYAGLTLATPVKQLKLGAAWDYAKTHDNAFPNGPGKGVSAHIQTVGLYASVQATEKLSFHARGEWVDISDAVATGGRFNTGAGSIGGLPPEAIALTGTVQYDLWANVLTRLEIRWEHALSGSPFGGTVAGDKYPGNGEGGDPGNSKGADQKNSVLIAANIIYKF